jgi:hypothetical protein
MATPKATNAEMCRAWRQQNLCLVRSRIQCECGSSYTYPNKSQHFNTKKHKYQMEIDSLRKQLHETKPKNDDTDAVHDEYKNIHTI